MISNGNLLPKAISETSRVCMCIGVTCVVTLGGGGGQNRPWVLGTLIYEGVNLERWVRLV
jgi:hypothetical protein